MNKPVRNIAVVAAIALLTVMPGCDAINPIPEETMQDQTETHTTEAAQGPHNGRLLVDGDFVLELAIFETGVPPEFRAWASEAGEPVDPRELDLGIELTRLGGVVDEVGFTPHDDFLRGDIAVYEPHSFVVSIEARHRGTVHRWRYDNFEGRTRIGADMARAFELKTEIAGPAVINETITVYGRIEPNPERHSVVSARFEGVVESVRVSVGDVVKQGQTLAVIESNESLNSYALTAPHAGIVTERRANPGEQSGGRPLFSIMDTTTVWVELAVFPANRDRVREGARVIVEGDDGKPPREGVIARLNATAEPNQAVLAHVVLDNTDGTLMPGTRITAQIELAQHPVTLAVKRSGLQSFRDFTVVYAQIGDEYEVRMLDLGRQDGEWVEVLGGLEAGTRYVTKNSYLVKADIEKSGAAHDH